ncbi:hypothetical protein EV401DRAFT_2081346 [Pisolithus croceorrhizus]|nr:hypothetical protein EV401DRAFT_2081346 [Pisolithus croceorrhizus]
MSPIEGVVIGPDDIVIVVMGPTASGKTTFIDCAAGKPDVDRGSSSCTTEVHPVRYPHSDGVRNVVFVDTPGCNNGFMTDFQLLGVIAEWLNSVQVAHLALRGFNSDSLLSYRKNIKLNGILYFHRISDHRIGDPSSRNYNMLKDLCGNDNCKNVVLVTTMWDRVSEEVGSEREQELQADLWGEMVNLGSTTHRFEGTTESAWKIINSLSISRPTQRRPLQIQREMVHKHLPLHRTTAGKTVLDRYNFPFGSEGLLDRLKRGMKKTGSRATHVTRVTVTLTDDPTAPQCVGAGTMSCGSSGFCSVEGYGSSLAQVTATLQAAVGTADLIHNHYLKNVIARCLSIALSIEASIDGTMTETHHALSQVLETATTLINVTIEHAKETDISADIKTAIREFAEEVNHVQEIVRDLAQRAPEARRVLQSTDVDVISSCANSMRLVCDVLRSMSLIKHDLGSVDDGLRALKRGLEIEKCSCGIPMEPERARSY